MNIKGMIALLLILILYILLNGYEGQHFYTMLTGMGLPPSRLWFWLGWGLLALSIFPAAFAPLPLKRLPALKRALLYVSSLYIGVFAVSLPLLALADLLHFGGGFIPLSPGFRTALSALYADGALIFGPALLFTLYGFYRARHIALTEYDIVINKAVDAIPRLRVVLLSDLHLGSSLRAKHLDDIVRRVQALKPDLFLLGGDTFDHGTSPALREHAALALGSIEARYGSYYVAGNHEHYLRDTAQQAAPFAAAGMRVLFDETTEIAERFYLVGARDHSCRHRLEIEELLAPLDRRKPILLLTHQPQGLAACARAGVDLQFSGHTHRGQIFPGTLLVRLFNGFDYGYLRSGSYQLIVTSGAGTWGFPLRIGSKSEIVCADIQFLP